MMRPSMRTFFCCLPVVLAALVFAASSAAAPDGVTAPAGLTSPSVLALIGNDDLFSVADLSVVFAAPLGTPATQHYGSYPSGSPDSGTCGNDWATDTFDRDFTVRSNGDGTYTVVEQFKNGSFVTNSGPSPGGCETNVGGTVVAEHTGSMHGYFIVSDVGMQTSTSPYCDAVNGTNGDCTTATFINTHFAPCYPAACTVTTYFDHYAAGDQGLAFHEWKNASTDRGGDDGDIADT